MHKWAQFEQKTDFCLMADRPMLDEILDEKFAVRGLGSLFKPNFIDASELVLKKGFGDRDAQAAAILFDGRSADAW